MGGEGLVGLSRAFQHAGASSVLASLWAVSDRSTAEWMTHFYSALEKGVPKDEAVQATQVEMRRHPPYAHPFHWAAFQLSGLSN
jgi:CHAT domain-containing protein